MAEKKKKKESVNINLPKARASLKRQKEMKQMKTTNEDIITAVCVILGVLLIVFILLGGINQRKAWEWFKSFGQNVGQAVSQWFDGEVIANDDGVYYDPNGSYNTEETNDSEGGSENNSDNNSENNSTDTTNNNTNEGETEPTNNNSD